MLKGKTKIQLFDAKTGKEVQRIEKHNMLTNAIANLLNCPADYQLYSSSVDYNTLANDCMPIATKGMAGIILHEEAMAENANNVMPDWENETIGYAGSEYSGTNAKRGSYNTNESGNITNGRRHVWDFGTDKANGTISAVSLTSLDGGNAGISGYQTNLYAAKFINRIAPNYKYGTGSQDYIIPIGEISQRLYCGYLLSGTKLTLYHYQCERATAIHIMDNPTTYKLVNTINVTLPIAGSWSSYVFVDELGYLHFIDYVESTRVFTSVLVDIRTGEIVSNTTTTIGALPSKYIKYNSYTWRPIAKHGGYIYGIGYTGVGSYPLDLVAHNEDTGEYIKTITSFDVSWWNTNGVINGGLMINANTIVKGLSYHSMNFENINNGIWNTSSYILYNYRSNFNPYFLARCSSDSSSGIYLHKFNAYIATINNLVTPVIKTNAQTMKITYEITETSTTE